MYVFGKRFDLLIALLKIPAGHQQGFGFITNIYWFPTEYPPDILTGAQLYINQRTIGLYLEMYIKRTLLEQY